jgi:pilus assembly protein Flp/PilA
MGSVNFCGALKMNLFARFANDESGATAIEYGLIAALIAVGIIAAATTLGGSLSSLFDRISTKLNGATG